MSCAVRGELFERLQNTTGLPAIVLAANWRGEYAVDLDEAACRVFFDLIRESGLEEADQIALVIAVRGGWPAFADGVLRILRGLNIGVRAYVPCRIDGAGSLLAIGARELVVHPFGGMGPVDAGPNVEPAGPLTIDGLELMRRWGLEEPRGRREKKAFARLARAAQLREVSQILARRTGRNAGLDLSSVEAMFTRAMGEGTTLGADELKAIGFAARAGEAEENMAVWAMFEHYEQALKILEGPAPRFVPSEEWVDEVEFEPAMDVPAAVMATEEVEVFFDLDTGSPDPDMERLHGRWRR
jgi:hypothetical protein